MKKRLAITALVVVSLLLITGCQGQQNQEEDTQDDVFVGGNQGLIAEFSQFGPTEDGRYTIFESGSFPLRVRLKNKGEEKVDPGEAEVTIKGINIDDFSGINSPNKENEEEIQPVSEFNEQGGEEIINFGSSVKYQRNVTGYYEPNILAQVDYEYQTQLLIPEVCFKRDLQTSTVCNVNEEKDYFASGAPVTVTNVEEEAAGQGIVRLLITIENVGGGEVTLPNEDFNIRNNGQVGFSIKQEPTSWECRSAGSTQKARLTENKATIRCTTQEKVNEDEAFTSQVELNLDYKYRSLIQQNLRIKEVSE